LIILFNGPPASGKDFAASYFKKLGYKHLSFKYQLYKEVIKHFNVDEDWFMEGYNNRVTKELPSDLLGGMSRREAMIFVSEKIIKPKNGLDYFGKMVASEIDLTKNYVISDGGFVHELIPILEKVGTDNFILVQLTREGCDFSIDSRRYFQGQSLEKEYVLAKKTDIDNKYVLPKVFDIKMFRIHNNSTLEDFEQALEQINKLM
jgi:hypothetical protein